MTFMMPYWQRSGDQNLSNETYRVTPEQQAKAQSVVDHLLLLVSMTAKNTQSTPPGR